ncbi:MAG: undecaprenyl-diphosphatase UppP [Acidobacteriota bacterium]
MTTFQAFVLAIVQGVTEFLPISSSAHLILAPVFFDWPDQGVTFDIVTNTGTLLAVVIYFRRDLWGLVRRPLLGLEAVRGGARGDVPLLGLLGIATVPVVIAGLAFYGWISTAGRDPRVIAIASIVSGVLLYGADHFLRRERDLDEIGWRSALTIGLAEALALVPGTSRSGITMTAGMGLGLNREAAAHFSFLLAIPVGAAALLHDLKDLIEEGTRAPEAWWPYLVGFSVSALSALAVIDWLLGWVKRQSLDVFVAYKIALGAAILWLA